jgi:DNA-binding NtrC family response regulator
VFHLVCKEDAKAVTAVLRQIATQTRPVATLVIGELHRAEQGLALLRQGAADYLERPLDLTRFAYLVDCLTLRARYARPQPLQAKEPELSLCPDDPFYFMESAAMERLIQQVRVVAPQETTILLGGESGTGKTRLARLIHDLSPRKHEPLLVINCGSLSANLVESEMFGHARGAFTGADREHVGKFAGAGNGTLVLDEIDSLPLALQPKLLRAVEERIFEPVGSNKSQIVAARLIAISNRDLEAEVEAGRFRTDLYYRLNVVGFHLPPLRERRKLIPQMAAGFIREFAARNKRPARSIAPKALAALMAYEWPGNIRELRNVIERAVALGLQTEIQLDDLPPPVAALVNDDSPSTYGVAPDAGVAEAPVTLDAARGEAEIAQITEALRRNRNNRQRTAAELGVSRMTLYKKLLKYGLTGAV